MANIKSQIKRNRQNEKRRLRNRVFRGTARTAVTDARTAIKSGEETKESINAALSALDKAALKGAIHPRNAARRKSRLMKQLATAPKTPVAEKPAKEAKPKAEPKEKAEKKPAAKKPAAKKETK